MKKLAEIHIGNAIPNYEKYGTPTSFILNHGKQYTAFCPQCRCKYQLDWWWYEGVSISCPSCGYTSEGNQIMYGRHGDLLPYAVTMKLFDFKEKIEIKIDSSCVALNEDITKGWPTYQVHETYCFDFKKMTVKWKKWYADTQIEREIGYIRDYEDMKGQTALWFLQFTHHIKKGNTFTKFLRLLKRSIDTHFRSKHITPKSWYRQCPRKHKLYANILSSCYAVRFFDAPTIPFGAAEFTAWKRDVLGYDMLPNQWEEQVWNLMNQGTAYQAALIRVLELPAIPSVFKLLRYDSILPLFKAYKLHDIDMAHTVFPVLKILYQQRNREDAEAIVKFLSIFRSYYPTIPIGRMIMANHAYIRRDILHLWNLADTHTKALFMEQHVPWRKLHDWLAVTVAKQKGEEIVFNIPSAKIKRLNQQIQAFSFYCIQKGSELKETALQLKNCSAGYKNRINENLQLVKVVQENEIKALLEIENDMLTQAKMFANHPVQDDENINLACVLYAKQIDLQCKTGDISIQ